MNHTFEEISEAYKRLPDDIKEAINHLEPEGLLSQIGRKHGLQVDQLGELADATALVMIGLEPMAGFIPSLTDRLKLPAEKVRAIADEVNTEIFIKIRESLQALEETRRQNPTTSSGGTNQLFAQKMGKLFRLPREEIDLEMQTPTEIKNDPYREPVE